MMSRALYPSNLPTLDDVRELGMSHAATGFDPSALKAGSLAEFSGGWHDSIPRQAEACAARIEKLERALRRALRRLESAKAAADAKRNAHGREIAILLDRLQSAQFALNSELSKPARLVQAGMVFPSECVAAGNVVRITVELARQIAAEPGGSTVACVVRAVVAHGNERVLSLVVE